LPVYVFWQLRFL